MSSIALSSSCTSSEIRLEQGIRYYIEIIHLQTGSESLLQVYWRKPGVSKFEIIEETFTLLYNPENTTLVSDTHDVDKKRDSFNFGPVCKEHHSHSLQTVYSKGETHQYVPHHMVEHVLPHCDYKPSYAKIRT